MSWPTTPRPNSLRAAWCSSRMPTSRCARRTYSSPKGDPPEIRRRRNQILNFIADSLAVAFGLVAAPYRLIMSRHVNRLNIRVTIHFAFVPVAAKDAIHRFGKCMVLAVREPSLRKTVIVSFGIGAICECCQHFAFGSTILAHQDGGTRSAEHSAPPCFGIEATVAPWCHCAGQPYAVCAILNTYQER